MRALTYLIVLICLHAKSCDEPEHYSWNLGKPDNIEETEIISDLSLKESSELPFRSVPLPSYFLETTQGPFAPEDCSDSYCEIP